MAENMARLKVVKWQTSFKNGLEGKNEHLVGILWQNFAQTGLISPQTVDHSKGVE